MELSRKDTLECLNCFKSITPPIYRCTRTKGHFLCSNSGCLQFTKCFLCNGSLQLAESMEKLEISKYGESKKRSANFCILLGLKEFQGCGDNIPTRNHIVAHMIEHGLNGVNGDKAIIIQELEDFTNPHNWLPVYFEAHDETFFLLSGTKKDCYHDSSLIVSWRCVMIGNALAAKQFCLQLSVTNIEKDVKIRFNCPVFDIANCKDSANSQVFLPLSQLKQFGKYNGENKLEWTINVKIGKKTEKAFQQLEATAIPKVKATSAEHKTVEQSSSLPFSILKSSRSRNTKVFMDLAYNNEFLGRLVIQLRFDVVPFTAENFRCLCTGEKGFGYKGTCFHFIHRQNYMIGGDVTKDDGTGGKSIYGDTFKKENFLLKHSERGILSMHNRGENTNGSVFIITLKEQPGWDGTNVVFGKVVKGMNVLDDLERLVMFFDGQYTRSKKTIIQNCGQCE